MKHVEANTSFPTVWAASISTDFYTSHLCHIHTALTWFSHLNYCSLQVLTFAGAIVNVMRIPEKWYHSADPRVPGKFDYWLNSHNLMHILVAGAMTHYSIGAACDYMHFLRQTQCPAWDMLA